MPNAIHSFSSAASGVEPPAWPKFLLTCLVIYFSLRLLWRLADLVVSPSFATANDIRAANRRLANPFRRYHPSLLLEALECDFPIRITIGDARQDLATTLTLAREHEADRRAHAQLHKEQCALSMALVRQCEADMRAHAQLLQEVGALSMALVKICGYQNQICDAQRQLVALIADIKAAVTRHAALSAPAPGSMREYADLQLGPGWDRSLF